MYLSQVHLEMSADIFGCCNFGGKCVLSDMLGGGQEYCLTSYNAQAALHNKELFDP